MGGFYVQPAGLTSVYLLLDPAGERPLFPSHFVVEVVRMFHWYCITYILVLTGLSGGSQPQSVN